MTPNAPSDNVLVDEFSSAAVREAKALGCSVLAIEARTDSFSMQLDVGKKAPLRISIPAESIVLHSSPGSAAWRDNVRLYAVSSIGRAVKEARA